MIGRPRKLSDADVRWLHRSVGVLSKSAMARHLGVSRRCVQMRLQQAYRQPERT